MALKIIDTACEFLPDRSKGRIVVESDIDGPPYEKAFAELMDLSARTYALNCASQLGCNPACLNGNTEGPYPVNSQGLSLDKVRGPDGKSLPPQHPLMQPRRYRIDVPVAARF